MMQRQIELPQGFDTAALFGSFDSNIKLVEKALNVRISSRNGALTVSGSEDNVDDADSVIEILIGNVLNGDVLDEQKIIYAITMVRENGGFDPKTLGSDVVAVNSKGAPIKAKTVGQKKYIDAIDNNTIVFGIGPAGTGKTYLAVAKAVMALRAREVNRIILTRPAVEAGEKLGFLPGDLQNKVDPYLRPLYDGMYEMLGSEGFARYQERGMIEVAPLAYMRGRTLDNAFIILDEAQNTTREQMKMFLTRIGFGSRAIVTGDITQVDLPHGKSSGLREAERVLKNIEDLEFCYLTDKDVVRHPLVQRIIKAYAKYDIEREKKNAALRERTKQD